MPKCYELTNRRQGGKVKPTIPTTATAKHTAQTSLTKPNQQIQKIRE